MLYVAFRGIERKESGPGGPGFDFTPEGWRLPLDVQRNDGMMEWWNNGILGLKTEIILILTSYLEN